MSTSTIKYYACGVVVVKHRSSPLPPLPRLLFPAAPPPLPPFHSDLVDIAEGSH